MRAIRISAYGTKPVIKVVPAPEPGASQVVVRVSAAALNPLDYKIAMGFMHDFFPVTFPYTLGTDLAGTVAAVGPDVTEWVVGDTVVARTDPPQGGALADTVLVDATHLVKVPDFLSPVEAAGIPTAAGTAYQALFETADLKAGQSVLVHAGAGGVGSFAIQMARQIGARVIATASGDGIAIAERLGADQVIDYATTPFETLVSDIDVVLDTIGGDTQHRSFGVIRAGGTLVATSAPPDEALAKAHAVDASFVFHQSDAPRLAKLLAMVESGSLQVLVDRVVPLPDIDTAFDHQASGRARGKIILLPEDTL